MNRSLSFAAVSLLVLALAGCATLTPYQPLKDGYGYSEQRLEADRYRVTVAGSSKTPRQTVENYLLYRAAELTLAAKRDYFVVRDQSTTAEADSGGPGVSLGIGGFGGGGSSGVGMGVGVGTGGGAKLAYKTQAEIVMKSGAKPEGDATAFDARQIQLNLQAQVLPSGTAKPE